MTSSWDQARALFGRVGSDQLQPALGRPLGEAAGLILAEPVRALTPIPAFDRSAMDGWAVAGDPPWIIGPGIAAGDAPTTSPLAAGRARPIVTGGPVPPGGVAILRREHSRVTNGVLAPIDGRSAPRPGRDVCRRGEEADEGEVLLSAGSALSPAAIALAAIAGTDTVSVRRRPTVDLVLLGDEVDGCGIPAVGRVRDAYGPSLPGLIRSLGGAAGTITRIGDDLRETTEALARSDAAVTVSTAGTSHGERDHMRKALSGLGCSPVVDGVAMRPGHPVMLARRPDGRPILALPGNPFAAMVCLLTLGAVLLDGMVGRETRQFELLPLAQAVPNPREGVAIVAGRRMPRGVVPVAWQGSAMLRGLAVADVLAVIPGGGARPHGVVEMIPLPW
ncbi:molybdopterin molybdotransferase MoeA [Glaciibacter sp. 2TAF33]|uniref:molybdopterin molybdotransferase MoeA n=1 Tax=Glaciibacter sp. 2TAF33 TaxID=3233015 RepID=UPI003F8DE147